MGGVQSSGKQPIDQDKLSEFQMAFKRKDINAIQKILGNCRFEIIVYWNWFKHLL